MYSRSHSCTPSFLSFPPLLFFCETDDMYMLALPNFTIFAQELRNGRKQILKSLQLRQYREVLALDIMKKELKDTRIPNRFHVLDVMGLKASVKVVPSTRGYLLKWIGIKNDDYDS
eukprot:m.52362 g.52362  ORF g.52362 m.52362 type:complete len:116 (-) comp7619_c0_seq4:145-492(-)